jgi:hypothetical protein
MAQWKGPLFDHVRAMKYETALRLLRSAADAWAYHGRSAYEVDEVAAVIVAVMAAQWSVWLFAGDRAEANRPLAEWVKCAGRLEEECRRLAANPDGDWRMPEVQAEWRRANVKESRVLEAARQMRATLTSAADDWCVGSPEEPATGRVLRGLLMGLFRAGLVRWPPPGWLMEG